MCSYGQKSRLDSLLDMGKKKKKKNAKMLLASSAAQLLHTMQFCGMFWVPAWCGSRTALTFAGCLRWCATTFTQVPPQMTANSEIAGLIQEYTKPALFKLPPAAFFLFYRHCIMLDFYSKFQRLCKKYDEVLSCRHSGHVTSTEMVSKCS